jgi:hypothetical protein
MLIAAFYATMIPDNILVWLQCWSNEREDSWYELKQMTLLPDGTLLIAPVEREDREAVVKILGRMAEHR